MSASQQPRYLGDGVYIANDGFQLWLGTGDHENMTIAIDGAVFAQMIHYAATVMGWRVAIQAEANADG